VLLQNIALVSHLLPLFLFFLFFRRNNERDIRVILFYCLYSFVNDIVITHLNTTEQYTLTFILLSAFTLIEYALFSYVLYINIKKAIFRKLILIISPFFIVFSIFQFLRSAGNGIDSISITVEYILLIIYCLFYFFDELIEPNATFIYATYKFWILVAILIYSTGTFFLFLQSSDLTPEEWNKWSIINHLCTIAKTAFFSVAVIMRKEPQENHFFDVDADHLFENHYKP